jgi:hypothetical protein
MSRFLTSCRNSVIEFFQYAFQHERSDLSHWRKRLGDKLELLLVESLRVAHEAGALRGQDLKRVTVDTTMQPKAITFPTDAKLKGLNRLARRRQAAAILFSRGQGRREPLPPCRRVQAASAAVAYPVQSAGPDHPRHPPQDHCRRQNGRRIGRLER